MVDTFSWKAGFEAAGIAAGAGAAYALLARDFTISFLRKEFGPDLRRISNQQVWIIGVAAAAAWGFLLGGLMALIFQVLGGEIIPWSGACLLAAAGLTILLGRLFEGWYFPLALLHGLVLGGIGVSLPYIVLLMGG
jgi:hypothetical protein